MPENSGREPSLGGEKKTARGAEPRLAGDRAVLHMVEQLDSPDPIVRERAALALGELGDERVFDLLLELARHPSRVVALRALRALANFTSPDHFEPQLAIYWEDPYPDRAATVIACDRERAFDAFMAATSSQDGRQRRIAAWALEQFDDRDLIPLYIGLLEDGDPNVRLEARSALRDRPDVRAVPALLTLLNSPDFHEIQSAAMILGKIGDPRAVEPLLHLALGSSHARAQAAWALRMLHNPEVAAAVIAVALDREEDPARRLAAAKSLGDMRERAAIEPLLRIYDDLSEDPQLRHKILEAIGKIGGEEAEDRLAQEITNADAEVRLIVVHGLSASYTERSAQLILTLIDDPAPMIQSELAEFFDTLSTQIHPQVTWPAKPFIEALRSDRPAPRKYAAQALSHIRADEAPAALAAALDDPDPEVRAAVIFTLVTYLTAAEVAEMIIPLLKEGHLLTRIAAIRALRFHPFPYDTEFMMRPLASYPRVIEAMIALIDDPDPTIRYKAISTIGYDGTTTILSALIRHLADTEAPPRELIEAETEGLPIEFAGGRVCDIAAACLDVIHTPESMAAVEAWRREQAGRQ